MEKILNRLKEDYPDHEFSIVDKNSGFIIRIDKEDTKITYAEVDNLLEEQVEDRKSAEEALYEVLKIEVGKFLNNK